MRQRTPAIVAAARTREISGFQFSRLRPGLPRPGPARPTQNHEVRWSADSRPPRPPIVRWCYRKFDPLQRDGGGGQGRNRTTDTRIFSTTESRVRREQAEDREGISARADRASLLDRSYPEPEARRPDPRPAGPIRFNGLGASRPNSSRAGRRTGPPVLVPTVRPHRHGEPGAGGYLESWA